MFPAGNTSYESFLPFRSNLYSSKFVSINIVSLDESFSLSENINSTLASFIYFVIFYRWIRLFRNPDTSEFIAIDIIFAKNRLDNKGNADRLQTKMSDIFWNSYPWPKKVLAGSLFWSGIVFEGVHSHVMDLLWNLILVHSISLRNLWSRVKIRFWSNFQ